jgi:hypothetical protein
MTFVNMNTGPRVDTDEAKLRQLDALIAEAEEWERKEAARKAQEARQRAEREAARPGYTLDELKRRRASLAAEIALRQTHLRTGQERELLRHRVERLQADIEAKRAELARLESEQAGLMAKLPA